MRSSFISLGLAAVIGVVIGLLLQTPSTPPNTTPSKPSDAEPHETSGFQPLAMEGENELDILRQQLQQEISARKKLQDKVDKLSQKIARLDTQKPTAGNAIGEASPHQPPGGNPQNRAWFNRQALIEAGVDTATADSIKTRFEKQELEKLYLRDQAIREGWLGSRRYRDELKALDEQFSGLQKELGDEAYAAYLFATGQPNQVMVQSVLANSSADTAGIQANDQILRYGEQRIYNWQDLRTATTQGNSDETVSVEVIRDGKRLQLYVQRGPLGIRMNSSSTAP